MTPKRHFPDWISAYFEYAKDNYCPDAFHLWTGMSVISGALERRVWLREGHVLHYPNTFIMLVANPGVGKSTAITRGTPLLYAMKKDFPPAIDFKIFSGLMTHAGLMEKMKIRQSLGTNGSQFFYSSGYYFASEASNSGLQNLSGDFNATITELYDCADLMQKTLKDREFEIPHPSLCVLAGTTFDFLKTLVNQNSVMGGLASRFIYVTVKERKAVESLWGKEGSGPDHITARKLVEDLRTIVQLCGEFKIESRALDLYEDWWKVYQAEYLGMDSERMQSITTRKPTTLKKIMMLLSVSERNDLGITREHVEKAIQITEEVTKDNAMIISSAMMANKNTPEALQQFVLQTAKAYGNSIDLRLLKQRFIHWGGDSMRFDSVTGIMTTAGMISYNHEKVPGQVMVDLHVDPDRFV